MPIFGNFPNKRLQLNLCFTLRLQFIFKYLKSQNERVLSQTFSTKPHTNFVHFLSRRSRIVITNLFKNTLQRKSASMKICLDIMETLNAESYVRCCFVEKKILYFRKVFDETTHIGGLFSRRWLQEPLQNISWSTLQQDLTACRR